MTPDALVDAMVPVAMRLVAAVHDDGPGAVADTLGALDDQRRTALLVVLAAMVDPDRRPSELLGWLSTPLPPVHRPVAHDPLAPLRRLRRALAVSDGQWTDEAMRAARSARAAGHDSALVVAGDRAYQRAQKALQRARRTQVREVAS